MKRYLVFSGDTYYPAGGWNDFRGDFDTEEAALAAVDRKRFDWWHVIDATTGQEIAGD